MDEKEKEEIKKIFTPLAEKVSEAVYQKMEEKKLRRQAIQEGLT